MSVPLIFYVLKAALRDRLIIAMLMMLAVGTSLSIFLGSAAVIEKGQFVVVFAAAGLRLTGVLGLVLFVVFMIRRSFEAKDIEFLLSRPISRIQFILSYAAAFSLLAIILGLAEGLCIYSLAPLTFDEGHALWILSIVAENVIMVNTALFFSMVISAAAPASMAVCGFYILARLMGQVLGIIDTGSTLSSLRIAKITMEGISSIMPRLDLLGQTSWLIYGIDNHVGFSFVIVQGLVFSALIITASLIDLIRRQF